MAESNAARASEGAGALALDVGLTAVAEAHAREMAELGYFGHTSPVPANATLGQRVANAGSPLVEIAENLARMLGVADGDVPRRTVQGWLDSPGHRQNLLNPSFNRVGFGLYRDPTLGLVIVQVLGWEPYALASRQVAVATRVFTDMVLRFDSRAAVEVVLSFGGGPGTPLPLPAGVSDVVLVPLSQDAELGVGVRQGRAFVYDDGATLHAAAILASAIASDPAGFRGTFTPARDAPRRHTRLIGAFSVHGEQQVVRVALDYLAAETGSVLAVFDGRSLASSEIAPGRFEIELPLRQVEDARARGAAEVLVGVANGSSQVRVFHRFALPTDL